MREGRATGVGIFIVNLIARMIRAFFAVTTLLAQGTSVGATATRSPSFARVIRPSSIDVVRVAGIEVLLEFLRLIEVELFV